MQIIRVHFVDDTGLLLRPHFTAAQHVADIVRQSTDANDRDWAVVPEFDNSERDHTKYWG